MIRRLHENDSQSDIQKLRSNIDEFQKYLEKAMFRSDDIVDIILRLHRTGDVTPEVEKEVLRLLRDVTSLKATWNRINMSIEKTFPDYKDSYYFRGAR